MKKEIRVVVEPLALTPEGIRELRQERGLTQTQLANLVGVTKRTILRWEKGTTKPSVPAGSGFGAMRVLHRLYAALVPDRVLSPGPYYHMTFSPNPSGIRSAGGGAGLMAVRSEGIPDVVLYCVGWPEGWEGER